MSKLTEWYFSWTRPVREGVYQVRTITAKSIGKEIYSYWDGNTWYRPWNTVNRALGAFKKKDRSISRLQWRGLTKES